MGQKNETTIELQDKRTILKRTINAPRELVFEAFTDPKHLAKWFGPRIFTARAEGDAKPGNRFKIVMIGSDMGPVEFRGREFPFSGIYKEVIKPEKIVMTTDLSDNPQDWQDLIKSQITNYQGEDFLNAYRTITFEEDGKNTLVTITDEFASNGVRDAYAKTGMKEGWAESLDKLEEMLS